MRVVFSCGARCSQVKGVGPFEELCKPFSLFTLPFVEIETLLQDIHDFILCEQTGELFGEPGMPSQLSTQQDAIASAPGSQRPRGTDLHTFTAPYTSVIIDQGYLLSIFKANGILAACLFAQAAKGAGFLCEHGLSGADDAHVLDLWL